MTVIIMMTGPEGMIHPPLGDGSLPMTSIITSLQKTQKRLARLGIHTSFVMTMKGADGGGAFTANRDGDAPSEVSSLAQSILRAIVHLANTRR